MPLFSVPLLGSTCNLVVSDTPFQRINLLSFASEEKGSCLAGCEVAQSVEAFSQSCVQEIPGTSYFWSSAVRIGLLFVGFST